MNVPWYVFLPAILIVVAWLTVPVWMRALIAWWDFLDKKTGWDKGL